MQLVSEGYKDHENKRAHWIGTGNMFQILRHSDCSGER